MRQHVQYDRAFDLDLPLSEDTDDGEAVARIVQGILGGIEDLKANEPVSDRDLVQALTIATAVRAAVANLSEQCGQRVGLNLLDVQLAGRPAGRLDA